MVVSHRLSCSEGCRLLLDQGSNLCLLRLLAGGFFTPEPPPRFFLYGSPSFGGHVCFFLKHIVSDHQDCLNKMPQTRGLDNRNEFSQNSGGQKPEIKVSAELVSPRPVCLTCKWPSASGAFLWSASKFPRLKRPSAMLDQGPP